MLDIDLAELYEVPAKRLNEQVRRNLRRFPEDFMFQMTAEEFDSLRSQITISNIGRGGRRYLPLAFTEQGVAMLSSVLRSERAVDVNIEIMRAFVQMRHLVAGSRELEARLMELERKHSDHDGKFKEVFAAIRALMDIPKPNKRKVGFEW